MLCSSKSVVSKANTLSTSNYLNKHIMKKGISAWIENTSYKLCCEIKGVTLVLYNYMCDI